MEFALMQQPSHIPVEVVGGGNEERTEQQEAAEAELVKVKVLHAGHDGQQQQRQDLRKVERATEEDLLTTPSSPH